MVENCHPGDGMWNFLKKIHAKIWEYLKKTSHFRMIIIYPLVI
jgi:hypothetical protein